MKQAIELLPGAFHVPLLRLADARGEFVKTHAVTAMAALGITFELREAFYSVSHRDVIRGMHFQTPPHDHDKIVYCAGGAALDVLLDLRAGPGYGRVASVRLDAATPSLVFVPKGIAHGFRALAEHTMMFYQVSTEYAPAHDAGVRFDSFGFDWDCAEPVLSGRDRQHPAFADVASPFSRG
jgi:dTDP-4-dehydrorhamnose 3,5-epimerase/CDP-3, 6-dideoxy-D-glycero-D-glycero-4-hexulose-5-epimerase